MTTTDVNQSFGTNEAQLRQRLEEEFAHAMKTEGGVPTIHALVHSVARILTADHRAVGNQLAGAGLEIKT